MSNTDIAIDEMIKVVISEPKRWKVILLNDDSTPMEFVISVLTEIFKHTRAAALQVFTVLKLQKPRLWKQRTLLEQILTHYKSNWKKNEPTRSNTRCT